MLIIFYIYLSCNTDTVSVVTQTPLILKIVKQKKKLGTLSPFILLATKQKQTNNLATTERFIDISSFNKLYIGDCRMVHELDDLLSINQALICNCRVGEIAAPIPYEGDSQFHIRLTKTCTWRRQLMNYLSNKQFSNICTLCTISFYHRVDFVFVTVLINVLLFIVTQTPLILT